MSITFIALSIASATCRHQYTAVVQGDLDCTERQTMQWILVYRLPAHQTCGMPVMGGQMCLQ